MATLGPDSHPRGHIQPRVAAVIAALEEAYALLELGITLVPDPDYRWRGREWWGRSAATRERLIRDIDAFFGGELERHWEHWTLHRGISTPPEFARLSDRERLALCQRLDRALTIPWLPQGPAPIETETPEE